MRGKEVYVFQRGEEGDVSVQQETQPEQIPAKRRNPVDSLAKFQAERTRASKLFDERVSALVAPGVTQAQIARTLGVPKANVSASFHRMGLCKSNPLERDEKFAVEIADHWSFQEDDVADRWKSASEEQRKSFLGAMLASIKQSRALVKRLKEEDSDGKAHEGEGGDDPVRQVVPTSAGSAESDEYGEPVQLGSGGGA